MPSSPFAPGGLERVLQEVNRGRLGGDPRAEAERLIESLFAPSRRLAVYGTLVPGGANHHVVEEVAGSWKAAGVRGRLVEEGWAAAHGYPAMVWDPGAPIVPVSLLVSPALPRHWERIDRFEGSEYARILVPVEAERGLCAVANLYAARLP